MTDTTPERPEQPADPSPRAPEIVPERTRFVDPPPAQAPAAEPPAVAPPEPVVPEPVVPELVVPEPLQPEPPEPPVLPELPEEAGPAAAEPAAEDDAEAPDVPAGRSGRPVSRLLAALVALLVVAVGVLAWWAWPITSAGTPTFQTEGAAALKAAKADATLVLAYDYRHLTEGFAAAVKVTTDADGPSCPHKVDPQDKAYNAKANCFKSEYTRTHQKVVVDFATRYKTVVIAAVSAGGVERVQGNQVTVLLYVNQQSTNSLSSSAKITQDRVEMVMQKVGGRWLVAGITAL